MSRKLPQQDRKITISFAIRPELLAMVDALKTGDNDRSRVICDILQAHLHTLTLQENHNGG